MRLKTFLNFSLVNIELQNQHLNVKTTTFLQKIRQYQIRNYVYFYVNKFIYNVTFLACGYTWNVKNVYIKLCVRYELQE